MTTVDTTKNSRLLRISSVCEATGYSRSQIYNLMARNLFPSPIHPLGSRMSAWVEAEVNGWIAEQIEKSRSVKGKRG